MGRKTAVVLCLAAGAWNAYAAEVFPVYYELEPPPEERYGGAEIIRSGGYVPLCAREFPGTVTVREGEALRRQGYMWLGQVLEEEAGVYVEYVPGREGPTMVPRFRGGTGREVLLLIDGVPANYLATGAADLKSIPIEAIGRVEVLRGPASFRFGDRAVAGVVNVETIRGPWESARTLISASDGSFDTERYRFNFGMTARRFDLFASGNRILTLDPNSWDRGASANVDGRVARRWGEAGEIDLVYGHFDGYDSVLPPWSWEEVRERPGSPRAPGQQKNGHDRLRAAGRRRWGTGDLRASAYYTVGRSWFYDDDTGRGYQTRTYEESGTVSYTLPHLDGSALTWEVGGGLRGDAHSGERAATASGRLLEEMRPAGPLYLAVGASYDALLGVGGAVSPRLGVSTLLGDDVTVYGSFSGGARFPAAAELGRREEITRERGYEAGVRFYRLGAAEAGVAYFLSHGNDVYLDGRGDWTGELRRNGVEASAAGALPPGFDWRASYCFGEARRANGERAGYVPRHRAFGKFGYGRGFLKDDLKLRGELRLDYTGARRSVYPVSGEHVAEPSPYFKIPYRDELPAFWQLGAHFSIAVVSLQIYCNLENLNGARDYVIRPGYSIPRKRRAYIGFNWTLFD